MSKSKSKGRRCLLKHHEIVVVGSGGVGKSALTVQFIQNEFVTDYDPTIEDSYSTQCVIDGLPTQLEVFDSAGQLEFSAIRGQYLQRGEAFLIVFSVTDRNSLHEVSNFCEEIQRVQGRNTFPGLMVGNKIDLESARTVTRDEAKAVAARHNLAYLETSAKCRENVDVAFFDLVRIIRQFNCSKPAWWSNITLSTRSSESSSGASNAAQQCRSRCSCVIL